MTTRLLLLGLAVILFTSCAKEELNNDTASSSTEALLNRAELNDIIHQQMGERDLFDWRETTAQTIWSAALNSDSILAIGYTVNGNKDISDIIHTIDTRAGDWVESREGILNEVLLGERLSRDDEGLTLEDILPPHMIDEWPTIFVQVTSLNTVKSLMTEANVRYVEPTGYWVEEENVQRSGSGCSAGPDYGINTNDYVNLSPSAKKPWNFDRHNISAAWSTSTGNGQRLCIIDSGASYDQDNLGSNFNSGNSSGRNIEKRSTKWSGSWWWASLDSPDDDCGHGTSMAGAAAGPWSTDGNAVGVAYNADLLTIRAVEDVIISSSNEKRGVRDALKYAANRSDVDIASMSIGTPFYSSTVNDGVNYAYNRGLMMFSAAGTSLSWTSWYGVIFPATLSRTVAVTGVTDANSLQRCDNCHDGSQVDFVIDMQRAGNSNRTSLSLASYSNQPSYIGGSSVATATAAGIAALAWSAHPSDSRAQILDRLKAASQYYPSRSGSFGWGRLDASLAVQ